MSRTLARLRETLADEILVRTARGMEPTPRAVSLAREVRQLLEGLERALDPPRFHPDTSDRRFVLMSWDYTERVVLPPLLSLVHRVAPRVSLEVRALTDRTPTEALESGAVDLVIGLFRDLGPGFYRRPLFEDRFVCIRAKPRRRAPALDLHTFAALPHLLVAPFGSAPGIVDLALAKVGKTRHIAALVPHFLLAPELVAESRMIATIPERLALTASRRLSLQSDEPPLALPTFTVEAVWHERVQKDPGHQWLRAQLFVTARGCLQS
jgi:DNA-binding transcriptional LysR family regulator